MVFTEKSITLTYYVFSNASTLQVSKCPP